MDFFPLLAVAHMYATETSSEMRWYVPDRFIQLSSSSTVTAEKILSGHEWKRTATSIRWSKFIYTYSVVYLKANMQKHFIKMDIRLLGSKTCICNMLQKHDIMP